MGMQFLQQVSNKYVSIYIYKVVIPCLIHSHGG
jgi:hypothetical protein